MRHRVGIFVPLFCALAGPVLADQGAVAIDAGIGASLVRVPAPYADMATSQVGTAPAVWIDARYGLTNSIEFVGTAFAEPSVPYYVSGTTISSDAGKLSGTLQMHFQRYGLLAGLRLLNGNIWRLIVGADVGFALSACTSLHLIDVGDSNPRDFGLNLPNTTSSSFVLAPSLGVSWVGDKLSVTILPRFEALIGSSATWAVTVPVTIGWDFYL